MTKQVVEQIPKVKIKTVEELTNLIKEKRTVLVADISNIPGSQYQSISKKLRGKAIVKVPKRNLLFRALEQSGKKEVLELEDKIKGAVAILFSDLDSFELAAELLKIKSPAKAKPGQTAPSDIEIPAGPTDLTPGPAISELGALGIQIMIQGGKIEIKEPKVVAEEGKEISQGAADMLGKLNILPFTIGFSPVAAYDSTDNKVYLEINIDTEGTKQDLAYSHSRALAFAVELGYMSKDTVGIMIAKAGSHENKLIRTINGEPEEVPVEEAPKEETPKEEVKEEPKADAGEGLASLFG